MINKQLTEIQNRWRSLIDEAYTPYKEKAQEKYDTDSSVFKKLGVTIIDMNAIKDIGIRFLDTMILVNPDHWYFSLFDSGETFFKYLEMDMDSAITVTDMFATIISEYENSDIVNNIIKEQLMAADFEQEQYAFNVKLFEYILALHGLSTQEQEKELCFLKDTIKRMSDKLSVDGSDIAKALFPYIQNQLPPKPIISLPIREPFQEAQENKATEIII